MQKSNEGNSFDPNPQPACEPLSVAALIYDAYLMVSHECHDISTTCLIFITAKQFFMLAHNSPSLFRADERNLSCKSPSVSCLPVTVVCRSPLTQLWFAAINVYWRHSLYFRSAARPRRHGATNVLIIDVFEPIIPTGTRNERRSLRVQCSVAHKLSGLSLQSNH